MSRLICWTLVLGTIALAIRSRYLRARRRMRGEPEPVQQGPRNITLILIAIVLVYGLFIAYRLYWHGLAALH